MQHGLCPVGYLLIRARPEGATQMGPRGTGISDFTMGSQISPWDLRLHRGISDFTVLRHHLSGRLLGLARKNYRNPVHRPRFVVQVDAV